MRSVKRIIKIHEIQDYNVSVLFNNGESRVIDFEKLFKDWKVKKGDIEFLLSKSLNEFQKLSLEDGTLVWKNIPLEFVNDRGQKTSHHYDIDPIVLYEASQMDPTRALELGLMIKQGRKELGLTQEELANKSGTSKHYISRIENNKSGIEMSTLIKIIEGGLGKRLQIRIV